MADYWKSIDKKYCDVCKCWITDNKSSIAFHENGTRHKIAIQTRLREIHKKNRTELKTEKKFQNDMRKIEEAALAASVKDMEANPDVSMKVQTYLNMLKEQSGGDLKLNESEASTSEKKLPQPTIQHRSDKQKKADEAVIKSLNKPTKSYHKIGGWGVPENSNIGSKYLELPSKSSKSPAAALLLSTKAADEKPVDFEEKTVTSSSAASSIVKSEEPEVAFKKRKFNKGSMRRRDDDN